MVRIHDILRPDCVLMGLPGGTKEEVLRAMTQRLAEHGLLLDAEEINTRLMEREDLMTTGVKPGFAFPHAFSHQLHASFLTIGVPTEAVDYDSLDGRPVEYIFLLLGPHDDNTTHLRSLARISRLMSEPSMIDRLHAVDSPDSIVEVLEEAENNLKFATAT